MLSTAERSAVNDAVHRLGDTIPGANLSEITVGDWWTGLDHEVQHELARRLADLGYEDAAWTLRREWGVPDPLRVTVDTWPLVMPPLIYGPNVRPGHPDRPELHRVCGCAFHPVPAPHWHACSTSDAEALLRTFA